MSLEVVSTLKTGKEVNKLKISYFSQQVTEHPVTLTSGHTGENKYHSQS